MTDDDKTIQAIRKKAERMHDARRKPWSPWSHFAQAGAVGWVFILPVVACAIIGHLVVRGTGRPLVGAACVILGVVLGGYLVWRQLRRVIDEEHES